MTKKPKPTGPTADDRRRAEEIAVCKQLTEVLTELAGCNVHVEAVNGYVYRRGGAMSLKTMQELIKGLSLPTVPPQSIGDVIRDLAKTRGRT